MPFKSLLKYKIKCYDIFTGITKRAKLNTQAEYIKAPVQILISNDGLLQRLITKNKNQIMAQKSQLKSRKRLQGQEIVSLIRKKKKTNPNNKTQTTTSKIYHKPKGTRDGYPNHEANKDSNKKVHTSRTNCLKR